MKIKKTYGHVVHRPLSYVFEMIEAGGSYTQKLNSITHQYIPNRTLTPYVLRPRLILTDPDKITPDGDYTAMMVDCLWTLTLEKADGSNGLLTAGKDYSIDFDTHTLTIMRNLTTEELLRVSFRGDYVNASRGETQTFRWRRDLTTIAEAEYNLLLNVDVPSKVDLSPFKNRGKFPITAQLMNGDYEMPEEETAYDWKVLRDGEWVDITEDDLWYIGGKDTSVIVVDQDYIQRVTLSVTAMPKGKENLKQMKSFMLRRWYGQWNEQLDIMHGKYVFEGDSTMSAEASVVNRQGNISRPERYFELEILFGLDNEPMRTVGYGTSAQVQQTNITNSQPSFGLLCRELSAYQAIAIAEDCILIDEDGASFTAQFPQSNREV